MSSFEILDYIGVALFAATGALSASRKELDIIGFIFLASAAGIGGGTVTSVNKASQSFIAGAPWGFSRLLSCATRLDIKYVNTKENKAE
jgi:hypothetical protein